MSQPNEYTLYRKRCSAERRRRYREQDQQQPTTELGKLWKEYNKLFVELRYLDDVRNSTESAHCLQDEIYRKFITDISEGKFRSDAELKAMTLLVKLNVVNYGKPGHWWYA
jgi:hypothetical protein